VTVPAHAGQRAATAGDDQYSAQWTDDGLTALLRRRLSELDFLGSDAAPFGDVLGELISGPGKRLRPALVYWGYRAAGGPATGPEAAAAIQVGCAVELLHSCALICDDLMDESAFRRGEPAAHVRLAREHSHRGWHGDAGQFGRAGALVLGLQAQTWADAAICEAGLPADRLAAVLRVFTVLRAEVSGGQYLDLVTAARRDADVATAQRVAVYKSAKYTVERPLHLGAAAAGGGREAFLSRYGLPLGEAYQLRDDVLGTFGDPVLTGKPADQDLRSGKQTLLLVLGLRLAGQEQQAAIGAVIGQASATGQQLAQARNALAECGALAAVERRISALGQQALATVRAEPGLPDSVRTALAGLAEHVMRRDH
jgi:geranylgeranyl diphosphate synthase type I